VNYLISGTHHPDSARTIRWDDETLAIRWPLELSAISDSDRDGLPWPLS
jgi:dTDP-4-dehydrorhamnose 3,5-epimerase-like enzyme